MNKFLSALAAVALFGATQLQAMGWWGSKANTATMPAQQQSSSPQMGRHRMTQEEKLKGAEERTSDRQAAVDALKQSGFDAKNPRAFALMQKSLSSSQKHLANVKSGKSSSRHHRRHHRRSGSSRSHRTGKAGFQTRGRTRTARA